MAAEQTMGINWEDFKKQFEALKGMTAPVPTSASAADSVSAPASDDLAGLQKQVQDTQTSLKTAQDSLKGIRTTRYSEEYSANGLDAIKNKISTLDDRIASEKSRRDESISKVRKNPYYSAADITGESAEIERLANANINNLIEERNGTAGSYNSAVDEITKKISLETADKGEEVQNLEYNLNHFTNQLSNYQNVRNQELSQKENKQQWEMEFALRLEDAEKAAKESTKPKTSISEYEASGNLWRDVINAETGEVIKHENLGSAAKSSSASTSENERFSLRVSQGAEPDSGLRATAQRLINNGIDDPARMGYTGDLAVKLEAEMGWVRSQSPKEEQKQTPAAPVGATTEGTFRREVRNVWKEGYTPDQLKKAYGNITFSDSKKGVNEIIDDEWFVKNESGIKGWWDRLWRIGV